MTGPYFVGEVKAPSPCTIKSMARLSLLRPCCCCPLAILAAYCVPAIASGS